MASAGDALSSQIRRMVAEELAGGLAADPDTAALMRRFGLVDEDWLADPGGDPGGPLRRLRVLGREILDKPSMLAGAVAIEILGAQSEAGNDVPEDTRLAVVFTDLEGFSSFTAKAGDEAAGDLLASHYEFVDRVVAGRGGRVVKRLGDGHMATFGTASAAVLASVDLVRASREGLRLRAGGHFGGVVRLDEDVVGHTVNVASRVAGQAPAGGVRVSRQLADAAGPVEGVRYGEPVPMTLRGIGDEVEVCELIF